jgi:hypothetical protein
LSLEQEGIQHLQRAQKLLKVLLQNPLDTQTVSLAQHEFSTAFLAFAQVNADLTSLPVLSTSIPVCGPRLRAALDLLPLAIELSQAGENGCNMLHLLISRFRNPLSTGNQGLTTADFSAIESDFHEVKMTLNLAIDRFNHLLPSDWQVDPGLNKYFDTFRSKGIPLVQTQIESVEKLLPAVPTFLGIGTPTNYLLEVLD